MLTISDILQLEPLMQAEARVLAAPDSLNNEVSWVHISEMERLAHLFNGGELLLTQGRGIPQAPDRQREWVRVLAEEEIAGVAIEVGHVFDEVPEAVVEEASAAQVPLIRMSRPAYFMEITRAVHSSIVNTHHDALQHAERLGKRLSLLVMAGGSLQEAMDEVASALSHPVALTGPTHFLQAFAPRNSLDMADQIDWRSHTKNRHVLTTSSEPTLLEAGDQDCLYFPIVFQGEVWGCIHVLLDGQAPNELTTRTLSQAAMSIGLSYAVQQSTNSLGGDIRSEIIQGLFTPSTFGNGEFQRRVKQFGIDPELSLRVAVAEPINPALTSQPIGNDRRRFEALLALARELETTLGEGSIVGFFENRVTAIVPDDGRVALLENLSTETGITPVIGCSGRSTVHALGRAGRDAIEALRYAIETGCKRGIHYADQLFLERVLLKLDEDATMRELIERELGNILDDDARGRSSGLETLEAFFQCSGSKSQMARKLHIDRRTVHHRLKRVDRLVGNSLSNPDKLLSLHLAIRAYRLFEARL